MIKKTTEPILNAMRTYKHTLQSVLLQIHDPENAIRLGEIFDDAIDCMKKRNRVEEILEKLQESYEDNKASLVEIQEYIEQYGCLDNGLYEAEECFEQGWNNCLEYVFSLFKEKIDE